MAVAAVIQNYYVHDETVKVLTVQIEEYLNGDFVANETLMDWGSILPGETATWQYDVKNVGSVDCVVTRVTTVPEGWVESWTGDGVTIMVGDTLLGTLTLTVPEDASGTYTWTSELVVTEAP